MALDPEPLRQIEVEPATRTVFYRAVFIPAGGEPDPLFALPQHGRWPTEWTLYTGTTEAVTWAEYCRNHAHDVGLSDITGGVGLNRDSLEALEALEVSRALPRRSLYALRFDFEALVDLTTPWAELCLVRAGFDLESFYAERAEGYGDCPALAALVEELGWETMIVPSAAWQRPDGYCAPVFAAGRGRLVEATQIAETASPTVALAAATTYPSGERPDWLGE
jgi:hypothetical protein